jgi:hypothetical protein
MKKCNNRSSHLCRTEVTACTRWPYVRSVPLSSSVQYVRLLRYTSGVHRILYKIVLLVSSELLFYYHCLSVYRVQLTDYELDGTFINQYICALIRSLAHLIRHSSSSSSCSPVNVELYAQLCEDNSLRYLSPECCELGLLH